MTYRVVDADENTADSDAAALSFTITVQKAEEPRPDLMVTSASVRRERSSYRGEMSFTLSVTVRNGGDGSSVHTILTYHRSTDATITTSDDWVSASVGIDPLGPGESSSHSVILTHYGTYSYGRRWGTYYGACVGVDPNETDTTNNCSASVAIEDGPVTIAGPDDGLLTYQGTGDHVFFLNLDGEPLDGRLYTLELGELELGADVYLIATNTTAGPVTPRVDAAGGAATDRRTPSRDLFPPLGSDENRHGPERTPSFDSNLPQASVDAVGKESPDPDSRRAVREGDTDVFHVWDHVEGTSCTPSGCTFLGHDVAATARRVVTDGTITFILWVEDAAWGCSTCHTQATIDALATAFLRPGSDNDIYDWVTAVFGDPWGPHDSPYYIPAQYADEVHMLLARTFWSGSFSPRNTYMRSYNSRSNERLMFYKAAGQEVSIDNTGISIGTMAHEFQHLVHWYQKVVKHGSSRHNHRIWLTEMASEVAVELVYQKFKWQNPEWQGYDGCTPGVWDQDYSVTGSLIYYNELCSLGIFLALNYGGVSLIGDIVRSERSGINAIEAALAARGHVASFGEVLTNRAVATLLSDNTHAPPPYRYNSGSWSESEANGVTFRITPVKMTLHWNPPRLFSIAEFNAEGTQPPHSSRFADLGRIMGTVRLRVDAVRGNRITVVVKE